MLNSKSELPPTSHRTSFLPPPNSDKNIESKSPVLSKWRDIVHDLRLRDINAGLGYLAPFLSSHSPRLVLEREVMQLQKRSFGRDGLWLCLLEDTG